MAAVMGDREARAVLGVPSEASGEEVRLAFEKHAIALDAAGARAELDRVVGAYRALAPDVARPPEPPRPAPRGPHGRFRAWPAAGALLIALIALASGLGLAQVRGTPGGTTRGSAGRTGDAGVVPAWLGGTAPPVGAPADGAPARSAPGDPQSALRPVALATAEPAASAAPPSPSPTAARPGSRRGHPRGSPTPSS